MQLFILFAIRLIHIDLLVNNCILDDKLKEEAEMNFGYVNYMVR